VRTATLGTGTARRHVVEWNNWYTFAATTANLTFQVKLFEGTGVIEIHYCSMGPTGMAAVTGSSATIGAEDATGTYGIQVANNSATGAVSGTGYRLTPR
jgi:hypothetical protein